MELAGTFEYQPAFTLDESSTEELLDVEEIDDLVDDPDMCHAVVDYNFEDVEANVLYGEIGSEGNMAKFFLRTVVDEDGLPEEVKVYVPEDQEMYPSAEQFWTGFNQPETSGTEERQMFERARNIAKNFKTGQIVIIDAADLIPEDQQDA